MANQMLSTTSYGGGSSAPPQKSPLQLKIEENQRIYNEYVKNNPPAIGLIPGSQGGAPTPPKPEYEDQALLSKLTMLTPEEAFAGETFDTLSDLDQYNFAQAFTQFQPQLRDPSYVSPYGAPDGRQIFSRRYGIKDGGRVGLFMGGPALEGQALSIYNSMNAYGFDDQAIANALQEQGLYTPGGSTPDAPDTGIIGAQLNNDKGSTSIGAPSSLVSDFKTQTQNRQKRLTNPNKVQSFINKFTGGGQADIGEMIRTGQIDTRKTSGIPLGVGAAFARMMPDKYYDMSLGDQVFTQSQMGYTGPTVFGENTSGLQKDPFGLNTRSAFGNYAEAVGEDFASLSESLTGRLAEKYGVEFDEETGMFVGANAKLANKMTNMMRTKYNFRKDQLAAKNRLDSQIKAAEAERQRQIELQKKIEAEAAAGKSMSQIGRENFTGEGMAFAPRKDTYTGGKTVSSSSVPGGKYGSPKKDGGLIGYNRGGLATMFTRRR
jgi:hypothetical protein